MLPFPLLLLHRSRCTCTPALTFPFPTNLYGSLRSFYYSSFVCNSAAGRFVLLMGMYRVGQAYLGMGLHDLDLFGMELADILRRYHGKFGLGKEENWLYLGLWEGILRCTRKRNILCPLGWLLLGLTSLHIVMSNLSTVTVTSDPQSTDTTYQPGHRGSTRTRSLWD